MCECMCVREYVHMCVCMHVCVCMCVRVCQVSGRNSNVSEGLGYVMGTRMREAVFINTGLLALKQ